MAFGLGAKGGGVAPAKPSAGIFGASDPARYEAALSMLQSSMQSAGQMNDPTASFLAPIIGAMVSPGLIQKRNDARSAQAQQMTETLLGPGSFTPQMRAALEVSSNEAAPDYLRKIAEGMLVRPRSSGGGTRRASGGSRPAAPARLTYIARDPDGVIRGYNAATGKREPVPNADAVPAATPLANPPDPVLPRDPGSTAGNADLSSLSDEDLISKYR